MGDATATSGHHRSADTPDPHVSYRTAELASSRPLRKCTPFVVPGPFPPDEQFSGSSEAPGLGSSRPGSSRQQIGHTGTLPRCPRSASCGCFDSGIERLVIGVSKRQSSPIARVGTNEAKGSCLKENMNPRRVQSRADPGSWCMCMAVISGILVLV